MKRGILSKLIMHSQTKGLYSCTNQQFSLSTRVKYSHWCFEAFLPKRYSVNNQPSHCDSHILITPQDPRIDQETTGGDRIIQACAPESAKHGKMTKSREGTTAYLMVSTDSLARVDNIFQRGGFVGSNSQIQPVHSGKNW